MMKNIFKALLILLIGTISVKSLQAQGGFGGMHINSEFTPNGNLLLFGGGGAWVINEHFYLGGAGYGSMNSLTTAAGELSGLGYGGMMVGYFTKSKNNLRFGGDMMVGSGGYMIDGLGESFFFLEPNLKVWYSVTPIIHLSAGLYYRTAYLDANASMQANELNHIGVKLTLNFGVL